MKKKIIVVSCFILTILFIIVSIKTIKIEKVEVESSNTPNVKLASEEILMQVLRGEREFIDADGNEILIHSLKIEDAVANINQYTFVDLDDDSENELVAITDSYYGYYLVLHIDSNIIYGYNISINDMDYINSDGVILDKNENSIYYRRLKFNKNKYKLVDLASYSESLYKVNDELVDEMTFKNYENEYAMKELVKYRTLSTKWMEKKLNSEYSVEINKVFDIVNDNITYIFVVDKEFDNFKNDLLEDKINIYYMDSNNNKSKLLIRRVNDGYDKFSSIIDNNNCVAIYDESTQYIGVVINNNRLSLNNSYDIYYFKYYNKDMQYLGSHNTINYTDMFNEDVISELE